VRFTWETNSFRIGKVRVELNRAVSAVYGPAFGCCPRLIHETASFGAKQIPGLWSALIGNRVRSVIFVEEIMKKRLRHRVRVNGILFVFAVSIGPISFTMAAGKNEARVTQGNSQCAIARTERS